ncbi:hypothetical protein TNCV_490571 [Trichonephila clavipes]|nr:hypothetical protein TNCV_490571 [Trichonephila clavipes]
MPRRFPNEDGVETSWGAGAGKAVGSNVSVCRCLCIFHCDFSISLETGVLSDSSTPYLELRGLCDEFLVGGLRRGGHREQDPMSKGRVATVKRNEGYWL